MATLLFMLKDWFREEMLRAAGNNADDTGPNDQGELPVPGRSGGAETQGGRGAHGRDSAAAGVRDDGPSEGCSRPGEAGIEQARWPSPSLCTTDGRCGQTGTVTSYIRIIRATPMRMNSSDDDSDNNSSIVAPSLLALQDAASSMYKLLLDTAAEKVKEFAGRN
ncbi:hypothetical protein EDB80DRAFT_680971 [Ilyonectria destructans]|nr:hypothetical protein EDB80DRAFT_680971 [Ilyonectria destructans]